MYLTRLSLNLRSRDVRRDLGDTYEMHRTLVRAFVTRDTDTPPRILWRLEPERLNRTPRLLVSSEVKGNWRVLKALPGYLEDCQEKQWEPDHWLQGLEKARFRLFANPTTTKNGKRYGLMGVEAQKAWLIHQGKRHGFEVDPSQFMVTGNNRRQIEKDPKLRILKVQYEGVLRITDADALGRALQAGIGKAKGFGCGLLSLARLE